MISLIQWTEFEQTLGGSEGQGSLACCSLWGCKESDTTERLNSNSMEDKLATFLFTEMQLSYNIYYFIYYPKISYCWKTRSPDLLTVMQSRVRTESALTSRVRGPE